MSMKILVLCVDRDDDIGVKTGIKAPLVGREDNLAAATKLGLADPEDSDVNALLSAVSTYDSLVKEGQDAEIATICGDVRVGPTSDLILTQQLDQVLEEVRPDRVFLVPVALRQRLGVEPAPRRELLRGGPRGPDPRAELRGEVPDIRPELRVVLRPRHAPLRRREGPERLPPARAGPPPRLGRRGHLQRPRFHRPRDDPDPAAVLRPLPSEPGAAAHLPEHRPRDLPRRGDGPLLPDAGNAPRGTDGRRLAALV